MKATAPSTITPMTKNIPPTKAPPSNAHFGTGLMGVGSQLYSQMVLHVALSTSMQLPPSPEASLHQPHPMALLQEVQVDLAAQIEGQE